MSSYSSRYQSKLLNFISQQSQKVVDKCDRALRHLKFVAEGALQATLYPVYLLVQTARAIGRQLQQVGNKTAAQLEDAVKDESLNYPDADAPIQQVLSFSKLGEIGQAELPVFKDLIATSADVLAKLEKSSDSCLLALEAAPEISMCVNRSYPEGNRPLIVGVATAITTRNLVLVAPENQTLDILTAQQQIELQQKIFSEVANYWQQGQRLIESQIGFSNDLQLVANQANLFTLSRQFLRIMSWVQTSPLAVKVNLFGEAKLLHTQRNNSQVPISYYQLGNGFNGFQQLPIAPLPTEGKGGGDYQLPIANLSLTSVQSAIAPSQELTQTQTAQYTEYLTVSSQGLLQTKHSPASKTSDRNLNRSKQGGIERFEEFVEQIVELIVSAIAYFLGREEQQSEKELADSLYAKYKKTETLLLELDTADRDRTSEATALTWVDLFGETTTSPTETNSLQEKINLLPRLAAETTYAPPSKTLEFNRVSIAAQPANAQNLSKVKTPTAVSTPSTIATAVTRKEQAESSSVKPAPDWWEAQVISRGYIKHPLEQTLEWLDTALLWLEEIGAQLWNWAKIQSHKIFSSKN